MPRASSSSNLKLGTKFSDLEPMSSHALNAECIYLIGVLTGSLECLHFACNKNKRGALVVSLGEAKTKRLILSNAPITAMCCYL